MYSNSLGLVMGGLFLLSWTAQSIAGWASYNADQISSRQDPTTWIGYLGEADFWNRTLQNWQSELLAVGSFAVAAVYLRQRGSPESKPVGAEHADTAETVRRSDRRQLLGPPDERGQRVARAARTRSRTVRSVQRSGRRSGSSSSSHVIGTDTGAPGRRAGAERRDQRLVDRVLRVVEPGAARGGGPCATPS